MIFRHQHSLSAHRQARELLSQIESGRTLGKNGRHFGHREPQALKWRPRLTPGRAVFILSLALFMVGATARGCEVYWTTQAKITAAEDIIREQGKEVGWSDERIQRALESLHRRYRAEDER